jgi:L-seryl-tRNA(Ser) seleniumtransferase
LIGAEDVIVVNNNAAATLLAISACASPGEVLVSRGELVEIGGSFRIPDIIETGGSTLAEVGTTNRTRVADYAARLNLETRAILRVHSSNFSVVGFTEQPSRTALAKLAQDSNIPLIEDLGSGLLGKAPKIKDAQRLEEEESIQVALEQGADLVTFSGDKLLGGVQSGFIAGKKELVQRCAQHPLYRAMRLGKMSLLALETVLQFYVEGRQDELPVWKALQKSPAQCRKEAVLIKEAMGVGDVIPMQSYSGGGALPNQAIESFGYFLPTPKCQTISEQLRIATPSVLVRVQNGGLCVDPRTLLDDEIAIILQVFSAVIPPLL